MQEPLEIKCLRMLDPFVHSSSGPKVWAPRHVDPFGLLRSCPKECHRWQATMRQRECLGLDMFDELLLCYKEF